MESLEQLTRELQTAVATGRVPGVVAAAGDAESVIFSQAFGVMALDTIGWIASLTKALTTVAALQLVEQGKLVLDAPLASVVPRLGEVQVLEGYAADGAPRLRPPRRAISLRHLLTHTTGFGYDMWNQDLARYNAHHVPEGATLATPLLFDPGAQWNYGIGVDFAGRAVEAVSGLKLGDYFAEHITGPLRMADTAFGVPAVKRERLAAMYTRGSDGAVSSAASAAPEDAAVHGGGGGLYGTAPDYLRFARAILRGGELDGARILLPETVAEMSRNQIGDLQVATLMPVDRTRSNEANLYPGMVQKWGLGFLINSERDAYGRNAGSLGWAGLANSYYWIDPIAGVAGVILMQILPFADPDALECLWALERGVYGRSMEATDTTPAGHGSSEGVYIRM